MSKPIDPTIMMTNDIKIRANRNDCDDVRNSNATKQKQ